MKQPDQRPFTLRLVSGAALLLMAVLWAAAASDPVKSTKDAKTPSDDENDVAASAPIQTTSFTIQDGGQTLKVEVPYAVGRHTVLPMPAFPIVKAAIRPKGTRRTVPLFKPDGWAASLPPACEQEGGVLEIEALDLEKSHPARLKAELCRVSGKAHFAAPQMAATIPFRLIMSDADDSSKTHVLGSGTFDRAQNQPLVWLRIPITPKQAKLIAVSHRGHYSFKVDVSYKAKYAEDDLSVSADVVTKSLGSFATNLASKEGDMPTTLISGSGGSLKAQKRMRQAVASGLAVTVAVRRGANVPPVMIETATGIIVKQATRNLAAAEIDSKAIVAVAVGDLPPITIAFGKLTEIAKASKEARQKAAAEMVKTATARSHQLGVRVSGSVLGLGSIDNSVNVANSSSDATERAAQQTEQMLAELSEAYKGEAPRVTAMNLDAASRIDLRKEASFEITYRTVAYGQKTLTLAFSLQSLEVIRHKPTYSTAYEIREQLCWVGDGALKDKKATPGLWLEIPQIGTPASQEVIEAAEGETILGAWWSGHHRFAEWTSFSSINTSVEAGKTVKLHAVRLREGEFATWVKVVALVKRTVKEE